MSKRKCDESKEERWSRKLRKNEIKLQETRKRNSQRIIYLSDDDDVQPEEHQDLADITMTSGDVCINESELSKDANAVFTDKDEISIDDFDPDLLQALGGVEPESANFGDSLHIDIATPTLNPEIQAMLAETYRLRDKRLLGKQDQLGRALSALGKLIADSHYAETETRRSVIIPLVEKSFLLKTRNRDSFLFGEGLDELVFKLQRPTDSTTTALEQPSVPTASGWAASNVSESPARFALAASSTNSPSLPATGAPTPTAAPASTTDTCSDRPPTEVIIRNQVHVRYHIPFATLPQQKENEISIRSFSTGESLAIKREVQHLLSIKAIKKCKPVSGQFISGSQE
ncbi:unnamed protein product [Chilo suppressalis]|uniref:Uncharacterized protein n=1 Tax=Chilo suppressalis TaxID=168631 RepID=A0ABN8BGR6_CHISP|nr:unnamed protein product [Chilo suppressalis]